MGQLTGIHAVALCTAQAVRIITDRLGVMPVYQAETPDRATRVLGTHPEWVARAAGLQSEFDPVSLGEIFQGYTITFPYTTRRGMTELAPGACHAFPTDRSAPLPAARTYWTPDEPARAISGAAAVDALTHALSRAGETLTRDARRVAVTLSGGLDSRVVLACIPPARRAMALTYANDRNREWEVARRLAEAAGVPQRTLWRDPEFYAHLPMREMALLGLERAPLNAHGFLLADAGFTDGDLVVGGWGSDTLLKGYFLPLSIPRLLVRRRHAVLSPTPLETPAEAARRAAVGRILRPSICEAIDARRRARVVEVAQCRPGSAAEWSRFYPVSRHEHVGLALANAQLFPADELFFHRDVLEVARTAGAFDKKTQRLALGAFARLAAAFMAIPNSNTLLPPGAGWIRRAWHRRLRAWWPAAAGNPPPADPSRPPWFAEHSWVDYDVLQRRSTVWAARRAAAGRVAAVHDLLAPVFAEDPRRLFDPHPALDSGGQAYLVGLALELERQQAATSGASAP